MHVIDVVVTTDIDALVFGARAMMALYVILSSFLEALLTCLSFDSPNKKKDKGEVALYTSENIFISPDVSLTRGGLLLTALLAGGDYHKVCLPLVNL